MRCAIGVFRPVRARCTGPLLTLLLALASLAGGPPPAVAADMVEPGQPFPAWKMKDETGTLRSSAELAGQPYLLWYYPRAMTPGCTAEGRTFASLHDEFGTAGIRIFGVSFDEPERNATFRENLGLPFSLLTDDGTLAGAVGAERSRGGATPRRISYLVDAAGRVAKAYDTVEPTTHPGQVLKDAAATELGAEVAPDAAAAPPAPQATAPAHGLAMHGGLKYAPGFPHFDYVRADAPKGGRVKLSGLGTFDSFHPFIIKGSAAAGITAIYDTLMEASADEPFSQYGLLAESVEVPADRSWVIFRLRPEARWHDGKPVTADDVIWTFETLREKGLPFFRAYYGSVALTEKLDERTIRFTFAEGDNRELPLILGQLNVLPKHWWADRDFSRTTLDPPLGSGPYRVASFEPGRTVRYERVEDYWARDLGVKKGRHNFAELQYDYYRDGTVALEAFKAGEYDFRLENIAKAWATAYEFPAVTDGRVQKEELANQRPNGMQAFVFNSRRQKFADPRVRLALAQVFDFEWSNANLFYSQYIRMRSYFDNSELASSGLPSGEELAVLEPHRAALPPELFTTEYAPPKTDGSGKIRPQLKKALELLGQAGYSIDTDSRKLVHQESGEPLAFEILLVQPAFERVVLPYKKNLERLGVEVSVRTVDAAQYRRRLDEFDFDIVTSGWGQSDSPGNEQRNFWGSAFADQPGSRNLAGIRSKVVDDLIEKIISAADRDQLVARVRALDRVLLWGHWVIPQWHITFDRVAYWKKLKRPEATPPQGFQFDAWWVEEPAGD